VVVITTRIIHKADKINQGGGVSALCYGVPRAINLQSATWTTSDSSVSCPKCLKAMKERAK